MEFDTALPPDPRSRNTDDTGVFWDPAKSQRARDYYWVHSKVMEDSLLLFAHTVKQACNREQVVGMFHGYLQNHWLLEGGQATLKDLLRSPDVDFWAGPPQYDRRGPGEHACIRFLNASLKQHGKLWFSEADYRTSFMSDTKNNPSMRSRPPADVTEDLALFQRELAHELCEGANGWWFPMGQDWYLQEPIQALFEQIQRIGKAGMEFERASDTDIAAVVDLDSLLTAPPFTVNPALISDFKVQELPRIGAPVDFYELDDVLAPNAKPYKLYILLNCFSLSAQERRLIDQRLRRNGVILVWMFAPGLFQPGQQPEMSPAHAKALLGFGLDSESGQPLPLDMKLTEAGARYCRGFDPNRIFGSFERPRWVTDAEGNGKAVPPDPTKLRQRFFGSEGGEVLARFEEGGRPSIVMRQTARATDIWIGSVMAPADLLRSIARRAGCHLFCDGDEIIYANRSFLAIHTQAAGERAFRLRRRADVVEVFSGEVLGENVTTFRDRVDARRTRLYYLGDRKRWEAALQHADAFFAQFRKS